MDYKPIEEPTVLGDTLYKATVFQIVDAAGLLTPSMGKDEIACYAFSISSDEVVVKEQEYDIDNGGGYSVLGVLQWMAEEMLQSLRKRVFEREAKRQSYFGIV